MQNSFLLNLTSSGDIGTKYWEALKRRAIGDTSVQYNKSIYWPLSIYLRQQLDWRQFSNIEDPFKDFVFTDPASVEKVFPNFSTLLEFPFSIDEDIKSTANLKLEIALNLIKKVWPEAYVEFEKLCLGVSWFTSSDRYSYSTPKVFGVLFINPLIPNFSVYTLATSIIHEMGHQAFFVESSIDRIIPNDFDKLVFSPLRNQARPAIAAIHALVAMGRMLMWANKLKSGNIIDQQEGLKTEKLFDSKFPIALKEVRALSYTARGQLLIEDLKYIEKQYSI